MQPMKPGTRKVAFGETPDKGPENTAQLAQPTDRGDQNVALVDGKKEVSEGKSSEMNEQIDDITEVNDSAKTDTEKKDVSQEMTEEEIRKQRKREEKEQRRMERRKRKEEKRRRKEAEKLAKEANELNDVNRPGSHESQRGEVQTEDTSGLYVKPRVSFNFDDHSSGL